MLSKDPAITLEYPSFLKLQKVPRVGVNSLPENIFFIVSSKFPVFSLSGKMRIPIHCSSAVATVLLITARKRSLGQDNVFTPVCHSVHGGDVSQHATGKTPPGQTPPYPGTHPHGYQVGSTHPTVMVFLLLPAMKLGQGYVFTCVCDSVHRGGGWYSSMHCSRSPGGVVSQLALQVSRPTPRGEVEGSGGPGGSPGPHLRGKLRGLAGGVSRPTPGGGSPGPHTGGCIPACTEADPPPPPPDGYCCGQYVSYWNAFLLQRFVYTQYESLRKEFNL